MRTLEEGHQRRFRCGQEEDIAEDLKVSACDVSELN
jgi:hypothetical protein